MKTFSGGIHPRLNNKLTGNKKFVEIPLPDKVRVSLSQHVGSPAEPVVKVGDAVKTGQLIGKSTGYISASVHATVSGKITGAKKYIVSGSQKAFCIEITSDGKDEKCYAPLGKDWNSLSKDEIIKIVQDAGIVGMGGASFPTHVKLKPDVKISNVIVNAVECEPYLDADRYTICSVSNKLVEGLQIIMKALDAEKGAIGIEADTPDVISLLTDSLKGVKDIKAVPLKLKYPQGAEKQLISAVTGMEVPSRQLPSSIGCVIFNAGTVIAIYDAVINGKPFFERNVTFAGSCLHESVNVGVRIGTMVSDIIPEIGGFKTQPDKILDGGPMMGQVQFTLDFPVKKGTSGVLFLSGKETDIFDAQPCIRCGRCVDVCPMGISPAMICQAVEFGNYLLAEKLDLFDCIKCGCCSYVCPSQRELVQLIRMGEYQLNKKKDK